MGRTFCLVSFAVPFVAAEFFDAKLLVDDDATCCDYKVAAVPIKQPTERRVEAVN